MINKDKFLEGFSKFYKKNTGKKTVSQKTIDAVTFLIDSFNADAVWSDMRHVAYAFATMCIETGWTFMPIKEFRGKTLTKQQQKYWNTGYYGRGYVQITWKFNYEKASEELGVDFVNNPDLVMDQAHAFAIMTRGMHEGWFTGKKLKDYINAKQTDYKNSRRIINGLNEAAKIAGYAQQLNAILVESFENAQPIVAEPVVDKNEVTAVEPVPVEEVVDMEPVKPAETSGWGTWVSNIRAQIASLGLGGISIGSLSFLQDPLFIRIALGLLGTAIAVSVVVYIVTIVLKNKEKREREQRAHELTLKQMELAADPNKKSVRVVKK